MLKAFIGIILLAETTSTWFHASPTSAKVPLSWYFGASHTAICNCEAAIVQVKSYCSIIMARSYQVLPLDPCLCHFHHTSMCHALQWGYIKGSTGKKSLAGGNVGVFCKIVDLFQRRDSINALDMEVHNYATLENLQGIVIPWVNGCYDVWGLLRLLGLKDVGTAISKHGPISTQTRT